MYKMARFKQWQVVLATQALATSIIMFALGSLGWTAMDPAQYGGMAVSFEIEDMAGLQMCGAAMLACGLLINGRWRWSPALRLLGAAIVTPICVMLAFSAAMAPDGWPITVYLAVFASTLSPLLWWNLVDLRAAIWWGRS